MFWEWRLCSLQTCALWSGSRRSGSFIGLLCPSGTFWIPSCFCNTSGPSDQISLFKSFIVLGSCFRWIILHRAFFFVFALLSLQTKASDLPPLPPARSSQKHQVCFRTEFEWTYISFHNPYIWLALCISAKTRNVFLIIFESSGLGECREGTRWAVLRIIPTALQFGSATRATGLWAKSSSYSGTCHLWSPRAPSEASHDRGASE